MGKRKRVEKGTGDDQVRTYHKLWCVSKASELTTEGILNEPELLILPDENPSYFTSYGKTRFVR